MIFTGHHPTQQNRCSSHIHMEYSDRSYGWAIKQVSIKFKGLKSHRICCMIRTVLNERSITLRYLKNPQSLEI